MKKGLQEKRAIGRNDGQRRNAGAEYYHDPSEAVRGNPGNNRLHQEITPNPNPNNQDQKLSRFPNQSHMFAENKRRRLPPGKLGAGPDPSRCFRGQICPNLGTTRPWLAQPGTHHRVVKEVCNRAAIMLESLKSNFVSRPHAKNKSVHVPPTNIQDPRSIVSPPPTMAPPFAVAGGDRVRRGVRAPREGQPGAEGQAQAGRFAASGDVI